MHAWDALEPFEEHDRVRIDDVDHRRRVMRLTSMVDGAARRCPYPSLTAAPTTLHAGRIMDVRYGTVTRRQASDCRIMRLEPGERTVEHVRHCRTGLDSLSLAVLRHVLGLDACTRLLETHGARAGTHQQEAAFGAVRLGLAGGRITVETRIGRSTCAEGSIRLDEAIPEGIATGLAGLEVHRVIGHPAYWNAGTISKAETSGGATTLTVKTRHLVTADALRALRTGMARAA